MLISSCLKMQLGNNPVNIDTFISSNFQGAIDSVSGSAVDDLIVLSHLKILFAGFNEWLYPTPPIQMPPVITAIGSFADGDLNTNHPITSLSLVGFTAKSLRYYIADNVPTVNGFDAMNSSEWFSLIVGTDIADLNTVIQANAPNSDNQLVVVNSPITLKIMRCTMSDMLTLPSIVDSDYPSYTDAFDKVKARLTRSISELNEEGLSVAVYDAAGDYISLRADCYMQYSLSIPDRGGLPPLQ